MNYFIWFFQIYYLKNFLFFVVFYNLLLINLFLANLKFLFD